MSTVLYGVAGLVVLLIVTWAVAYKVAHGRGEDQAVKDLGLGGTIKEPGRESIPVNPNLVNNELKAPEPKAPQPERKPKVDPPPPAPAAGTEPRVVGLNYYLLASGLDKDGAQKIADFLTENGLQSAAAVDRKPTGSNNPGSYVVFVTRGIKPEEYKTRAAARTEVETQVSRLGKVWQKERKGKTDFSQAYWQRYSN